MPQNKKELLAFIAFCILITIVLATQTSFTRNNVRYVTEMYTVQPNDSLTSVSERYIGKNTGTVRQIDEFREGIKELNFDVIGDGEVKAGEVLKIGYWIKN